MNVVEDSIIKENFFEIANKYIENKKISHAYLIEISDYEKDFSDVLDFVKMILCNCSREELKNDKSNIGNLIDNKNYPDLKIVEPDGQWIKKNQLLEVMDEFQNKSLLNNKCIYIIKEAEKLNSSSANTILKFLEEPEDNIIAILLTKNRFQVIETILSRCQILTLNNTNFNCEVSFNSRELLKKIFGSENIFIDYQNITTNIIKDKNEAKEILSEISQILVNYLNYVSDKKIFCDKEIIDILKTKSVEKIVNVLTIIEEEIAKLEYNINYKLWLDSLFAQIILGG